LNSEAATIKAEAALKKLKGEQAAEISHKKSWTQLEIEKSKDLAAIEAHKFKSIVDAIGASTLKKKLPILDLKCRLDYYKVWDLRVL